MLNDNARIFVLTQAILAIVIVVGGGAILVLVPEQASTVTGVIGLVVGYFFRETTGAVQAQRVYQTQNGNTKASSVSN